MDQEETIDPNILRIILPKDDVDEDDDIDALIARNRNRKGRVSRGGGIHGTM